MSKSGIEVDPMVIEMANSFNNGDARKKYAFLTFRINEDQTRIMWVEEESLTKAAVPGLTGNDREEDEVARYAAFRGQLKGDVPRWFIYDCYKRLEGSREKDQPIWVHWCPDTVAIKKKMMYASSKDAFKNATKAGTFIECSDFDEIEHESLTKCVK